MLERLFDAAPEVLRRIALFTVFDAEISGPPRDFLNLTLVCRAAHRILSLNSAPLYADVFAQTFDIRGPICRLGERAVRENAKLELKRRFTALNIFRKGELDDFRLTDAFWTAYMMFEDADTGQKNTKHLLGSGLLVFLDKFLQKRLYRGSQTNNGWPIPNEQNSLAVALFWLSSSHRSVNLESVEVRADVERLLKPFVFAAFRYPIFSTAESCFDIATFTHQATSSSVHGPYPPPPLLPRDVTYFGDIPRTMRVPSISLFSALSFFARQETICPQIPPHLQEQHRKSVQSPNLGPTFDDIKHFADHCRTNFAHFPGFDASVLRGSVGASSRPTFGPTLAESMPYKLGTLTGNWQGSYIASHCLEFTALLSDASLLQHPFLEDYKSWLGTLTAPPVFPTTGRFPLYMSLQEHFTRDPDAMIPRAEGTTNAWLPAGFNWVQRENGIEVFDEKGSFRTFYNTVRGRTNPVELRDAVDVIITGQTDEKRAAAWGAYRMYGRIRLADGLIVLAWEAVNGTGAALIRGYGNA
ncbi:hypothetical protein D9615_007938 [Tricholomella constricta]|uniref:F-box domain-containing protein n=1 Tax=Tricholomella constricta TaxID=117010 RepID=A0A8H5H294_9AGAR|nr:hypothetical protein D9615_007938 [Tricholomella constricta]